VFASEELLAVVAAGAFGRFFLFSCWNENQKKSARLGCSRADWLQELFCWLVRSTASLLWGGDPAHMLAARGKPPGRFSWAFLYLPSFFFVALSIIRLFLTSWYENHSTWPRLKGACA